jgi:hypothetical protein
LLLPTWKVVVVEHVVFQHREAPSSRSIILTSLKEECKAALASGMIYQAKG